VHSWTWWLKPVISALGRRSRRIRESQAGLGYIARLYGKKKSAKENIKFLINSLSFSS
jgi:hypothetical protein